ncbi:MAG TPA: RsmD family RNA methyltransferase, partial [Casimicrobiaceae bacterium]|nr:RsmD family RNA methyltransferase [Casimicrobiaceae bacterium]
ALAATGRALDAAGLETHCDDAHAFVARERRTFDVVFLDPPFAGADLDSLMAAAAARVAAGGALYVEAGAPIEAPVGFVVARDDRAGRVHYHLLRRA